ncbi:hypothetical protein ACH34I_04720 [Elizabethkingia anophelis]
MNSITLFKRLQNIILTLLVFAAFTTCSSREDETAGTTKNIATEGTVLTFNVSGIEEPAYPIELNASQNQKKKTMWLQKRILYHKKWLVHLVLMYSPVPENNMLPITALEKLPQ